MYLRSVIFPAERDRVRQNKMVHVERPACEIIGAFQAADISAAIGDSGLIEDCQCKAAVVKVCAVQRDKCLGGSGKIAFCTVVIVRQDSLVVVDYGKPASVKGHRADSRVYWRVQIIGQIIGTQRNLVQSVRILRQDADAPLGSAGCRRNPLSRLCLHNFLSDQRLTPPAFAGPLLFCSQLRLHNTYYFQLYGAKAADLSGVSPRCSIRVSGSTGKKQVS